ncbi:unnamed protein product [Arctogadus glacialis]
MLSTERSAGRPAPWLRGSLRRSCRRRTAATSSPLPNSTEALELELIKTLQSEVAAHRRHNEASYKAALAGEPSADAAPPSNIISPWGPRQAPNRNAARGPAARTRTNPSAQPRRFVAVLLV